MLRQWLTRLMRGKVRSFRTEFTEDVDEWFTNPKCRSYRVTNQGDKALPPAVPAGAVAVLIGENVEEFLYTGQSVTFGGYDDSFRFDQLRIEFRGAGAQNLLIVEDVQVNRPAWLKDELEEKVEFCD